MAERGLVSPALELVRGSGLDTSSGADFIRQRIGLFGLITAVVGGAFLVFSLIPAARPTPFRFSDAGEITHVIAVAVAAAVWLTCRRRSLSLSALGTIDAGAVIVICTMWAFRVDPAHPELTYTALLAVTETVLARSIVVPSKAARTLRLCVVAYLPLTLFVWLRIGSMSRFVAVSEVLWAAGTIAVATITSRVIYDLRKSVREAQELGQYTLEEKLGSGGMGEVWRAHHRLLVRDAAIKLIRPELLAGAGVDAELVLLRFEREARATAALRSAHTVQLYDFGQAEDGTLFYVMEMLTGIDLERLVTRFGPVPAERAIFILRQICDSLAEAHRNGLTHRDIKPANIVVGGAGTELDFVKVLDFGMVRLASDDAPGDAIKLTARGAVGCTPAYAAPEVVEGGETDHRVDIYGLGCVGYWLLTGKLVFEGDTPMKVMMDHARTPPRPPSSRTEMPIPAELEQIILQCLEKDPARRPADAVELGLRLAAVPVAQPWSFERAEKWWRAHLPEQFAERPAADVLLAHEGEMAMPRRVARKLA